MIIETSCNHLYSVTETGLTGLDHVWYGIEVKRDRKTGRWFKKATGNYRRELVRKAASVIVDPIASVEN